MTQIIDILDYLKKYPVFNTLIVKNKLDKSSGYTSLFIHRLRKRGYIYKVERNKYTVFKDPFLIASRIVWPSYISCWSALKYHNLTEQVPQDITVITAIDKKGILFNNTEIRFIKTKPQNFFGYEKVKYDNFEIFIADIEKSIIDSALLRKVSFSEIKDIMSNNIKEINIKRFMRYMKQTGNKSLIKRFGYIFEILGKDYYKKLKRYIDAIYVPLDYSKKIKGEKNERWRLIINA